MKLLYQTHSPYARKVLVAAHETELAGQLEVIHHETSPTRRNEAVYAVNPLGKVPVLLLDDGEVLFDSGVICEYLDGLHGGPKLIPTQTAARYGVLRMQALAQGIADAGIAARWDIERRPEALRWPVLVDAYREKIAATCDYLEREIDEDAVDLGTIALATALSWIEFREVYDFRAGRPRLAAWYERFSSRPSMQATALSGATHD
ncbi:glutathione S-transferase family protein [Dyella sp. LX-66]|uniref:glutathione S-transferase family protein n=1 Tax=unclassified Dyella TaxID=2634549 RepID=UPI001BDF7ECF|nr:MULTISPECIES: glutathione S-transferase family protein [unclassified Dyella]MBT2117644.1 glutathione S-transferase family protein [Dyella sp. LX-1]MBT2141352.1 glutathione S-transferase family protein [Dyella sp. LX-66]